MKACLLLATVASLFFLTPARAAQGLKDPAFAGAATGSLDLSGMTAFTLPAAIRVPSAVGNSGKVIQSNGTTWIVSNAGSGDVVSSNALSEFTLVAAMARANLGAAASGANSDITSLTTITSLANGSGASFGLGSGANASITLTPKGDGIVQVVPGTNGYFEIVNANPLQPRGLVATNVGNFVNSGSVHLRKARGSVGSMTAVQSGDSIGSICFSGYDGNAFVLHEAIIQAWAAENFATGHYGTYFTFQGIKKNTGYVVYEMMRLTDSANLLLGFGDNPTEGTGKLQLAAGAADYTSGLGFANDTWLYRSGVNTLAFRGTGAAVLNFREGTALAAAVGTVSGDLYLQTQQAGKRIYLKTGTATTALTLDESQNATFAGTIAASNLSLASTFTTSGANALTLTTTGPTNVTLPTSGTLITTAKIDDTAYDATTWNGVTDRAPSMNAVRDKIESLAAGSGLGTTDIDTSAELRAIVTDETGTGALVFANGALGDATATSINKVAFTAPATGATLTIADGKTFTASNTLTLAGTDGSTLNIGAGGTLSTGAFQPQTVLSGTANQIAVSNSGVGATTISIVTNPTLPGNLTVSGTGTHSLAGRTNITTSGGGNAWVAALTASGGNGILELAGTIAGPTTKASQFWQDGNGVLRIYTNATPGTLGTLALTLDASQNAIVAGAITAGSGATQVTDTTGKVLSAALNTVAVAQGGTGATTLTGLIKGNGTSAMTAAARSDYGPAQIIGTFASPTTTTPYSLAAADAYGTIIYYGATGTINLPAGVAGMNVVIYNTGAFTITIDANGSEVIVRDGTAQTGGVSITLNGPAGNYVALAFDGARWATLGYKGTLTEGS